jgi:threonine/homoserine/homoserine lactone efflux protein
MIVPESSALLVFALASIGLLLIPGPAVLYIVAHGIEHGRKAAVVSALGVETGAFVHALAATLGLSAILLSSATAFSAVKYAGAAYLIFLGVKTLIARESASEQQQTDARPKRLRDLYTRGTIVNILNPKVALFFFAFLPQFVDPDRGSAAAQTLFLGVLFVALAACTDCCYAMVSGTAGRWLKGNPKFSSFRRYFSGSMYLLLGVVTVFTGSRKSK